MKPLLKLLLLGLALCGSHAASAGKLGDLLRHDPAGADGKPGERQFQLMAQNDGPTLSEAVEMVRQQYNGRIVSAETRISGDREIHYIKVLTEDGKVKTVTIPGRNLRQS